MKTFLLTMIAGSLLLGCGSEETGDAPRAADPSGPVRPATDPVTSTPVRTDSAWKTAWQGRWYYFESQESLRRFESDPAAYVPQDIRRNPERPKLQPHEVR